MLVEAKMANITSLVSDWSFNLEIVVDEVEGIVIHKTLEEIMNKMTSDKKMSLKIGTLGSKKGLH